MAEPTNEKESAQVDEPKRFQDQSAEEAGHRAALPQSWKYKQLEIGGFRLPFYASPQIQLVIVAFVCFLCPGMFNALTGMGGGGNENVTAADDANTALYSTFAVIGFAAGTFTNVLGVKTTLSFGGLGYCVYIASFLCYDYTKNTGFCIFAGALLGLCAGLLWCAQGTIMMSYPPEDSKGRYISWFWMIFNLGALIGSLIPLGQNVHAKSNTTVSTGTYVGFLVLTVFGALLAWCLVSAKNVVRHDGSKVILMKNPTWWTEIMGLYQTFQTDPYIVFMFPMFFSSNWFYTYQFNDVNAAKFDTRTKALNNVLYWLMQIVGALVFGYALDHSSFPRRIRARVCWAVLFTLTMAIWGGGYAFQKNYTRKEAAQKGFPIYDWTSHGYVGPMFLYMFYGFYDAAWQTSVYWYMGALTNNGRKLANFAGFYKGIQSAGSAIIWRLDGVKKPYINLFASCWALLGGSLLIALPLILTKIKDHVTIEEDLKFSDETYQDVAPTSDISDRGSVLHSINTKGR